MPAPLLVRWLAYAVDPLCAGALGRARATVENVGAATWREDVFASYHWLDERGNPIVWDGLRTPLPARVPPGGRAEVEIGVRGPIPPGRYRLGLDLVAEHRAWFEELGNERPEEPVEVAPRVTGPLAEVARLLLPPGATAPPHAASILAAHAEGYAVVSGSVAAPRRLRRELGPWSPGPGRVPGFPRPLLWASVLQGFDLIPAGTFGGVPAFAPPADEPWLFDASLVVDLPG